MTLINITVPLASCCTPLILLCILLIGCAINIDAGSHRCEVHQSLTALPSAMVSVNREVAMRLLVVTSMVDLNAAENTCLAELGNAIEVNPETYASTATATPGRIGGPREPYSGDSCKFHHW